MQRLMRLASSADSGPYAAPRSIRSATERGGSCSATEIAMREGIKARCRGSAECLCHLAHTGGHSRTGEHRPVILRLDFVIQFVGLEISSDRSNSPPSPPTALPSSEREGLATRAINNHRLDFYRWSPRDGGRRQLLLFVLLRNFADTAIGASVSTRRSSRKFVGASRTLAADEKRGARSRAGAIEIRFGRKPRRGPAARGAGGLRGAHAR
jgi:hypothetical protein